MELYKATNCLEYYDCAHRAIEYENLLYSKEDNNWTDLRSRENRKEEFSRAIIVSMVRPE